MLTLRLTLVVALVALSPTGARAQEAPYSNYLVGERAAGLGGAFVALADDPSAIFHNPGGLADLDTSAVSGSLWVLSLRSRSVDAGLRTDFGSSDFDHSDDASRPLFLAGVVKFGPRDEDGVRRHALSGVLLDPHQDEYAFTAQVTADPPAVAAPAVGRLEVRHDDSSRWWGLAYAFRASPRLSTGLSLFVATRSIAHDEVEVHTQRRDISELPADPLTRDTTTQIDTEDLVLRFGALYEPYEHVRLGLMLQPPGIRLGGSAEIEQVTTNFMAPSLADFTAVPRTEVRSSSLVPWEVRAGVTWLEPPSTALTLDLSLLGPLGSVESPVELISGSVPTGALIPRSTYRRMSFRAAIGFEHLLINTFPIRGGVLFDQSSAATVPDRSDVFVRDRVQRYGASLSVGVRADGWDFSIGALAVMGQGRGLALRRSTESTAPRYESTDMSEQLLQFFIAGGAHAVKRAVREIVRED